jgi:hypothetical protein
MPQPSTAIHSRKTTASSLKQHKLKKDERSFKFKSNDSYIYTKNNQAVKDVAAANKSVKVIKNKSTKILTTISKIKGVESNSKQQTRSSSHAVSTTTATNQQLSVSFKELEEASTCSSSSFNASSSQTGSSSGEGKNLNLSPSISLLSSSTSSYPNEMSHHQQQPATVAEKQYRDSNVTSTTSSDLLNEPVDSSSSQLNSFLLNSLSTPAFMSQSLTICNDGEATKNGSAVVEKNGPGLISEKIVVVTARRAVVGDTGAKNVMSMSMNMSSPTGGGSSTGHGTIKSRSSRIINSIIRMSTIGSPFSHHSPHMNRSSTIDSTMSESAASASAVTATSPRPGLAKPQVEPASAKSPTHHASSYFPSFSTSSSGSTTTASLLTRQQQISTSNTNVSRPPTLVRTTSSDMQPCTSDTLRRLVRLNSPAIREEESNGGSETSVCVEKWDSVRVSRWLEGVGMLSGQIRSAAHKTALNGKVMQLLS